MKIKLLRYNGRWYCRSTEYHTFRAALRAAWTEKGETV